MPASEAGRTRMRLPWLYASWGDEVFRTRVYGSKRTLLHLFVMSARDGWSVWILACLGWSLTIGPEDPVAEGQFSAREGCPGFRSRLLWRSKSGRVVELSYAPESSQEEGGDGD